MGGSGVYFIKTLLRRWYLKRGGKSGVTTFMTITVVQTTVISCLDFCRSLPTGLITFLQNSSILYVLSD